MLPNLVRSYKIVISILLGLLLLASCATLPTPAATTPEMVSAPARPVAPPSSMAPVPRSAESQTAPEPASSAPGGTIKLQQSGKLRVGQAVPAIAGLDDSNNTLGIRQFFPGQACVLLSFFRHDCFPCRAGLATLRQHQAELERQKIQVILVNSGEDRSTVALFRQEQKITFPVLMDKYRENSNEFGVEALPRSFLIMPDLSLQAIYREEGDDFVTVLSADCQAGRR
jgi:peroxiredoxin